MKKLHLLLLCVLQAGVIKAQDTLSVTHDSFTFSKNDYKSTMRLVIRDSQKKQHVGYLYKLTEHCITISNINPRKIDSANLEELTLTTLQDTNILTIGLKKNKYNIAMALTLPLIPASVATYYTWPARAETGRPGYSLIARIESIAIGVLVYAAVFVPSIIAVTVPQTFDVQMSPDSFRKALIQIQAQSTYKVYLET